MKLKPSRITKEKIYEEIDSGSIPLSQALKGLRRSIGKNQIDYAKLVGVSARIIRDFEQENGNPTIDTLSKIFKPFGFRVYLKRIR